MTTIEIIGIGSTHGNDRLGWRIIERLRRRDPVATPVSHAPAFLICEKPIDISQHVSPTAPGFFIDAKVSKLPVVALLTLDYPFTTVEHRSQFASTHGYSILDTLRLAIPFDRLCPCSLPDRHQRR